MRNRNCLWGKAIYETDIDNIEATKDEAKTIEMEDEVSMQGAPEPQIECPSCHAMFENNNFLIKHLLKIHCSYSGLICPYCPGHFPSRFIDLQSHVTSSHMDQLTGYNICNRCKGQ